MGGAVASGRSRISGDRRGWRVRPRRTRAVHSCSTCRASVDVDGASVPMARSAHRAQPAAHPDQQHRSGGTGRRRHYRAVLPRSLHGAVWRAARFWTSRQGLATSGAGSIYGTGATRIRCIAPAQSNCRQPGHRAGHRRVLRRRFRKGKGGAKRRGPCSVCSCDFRRGQGKPATTIGVATRSAPGCVHWRRLATERCGRRRAGLRRPAQMLRRLDSSASSSSPRYPAAVTTLRVCHRRARRSG